MIESAAHEHPICRTHTVAGIARSGRRHVPGGLPPRLHPVVTSRTGTGCDSKMFKGGSSPSHCSMATVTGQGRRNMSGGLALRGTLIMAPGASTRSHAVMGEKRGFPVRRPMATIAIDRGRQVIRRFERGNYSSTWGVTLHTLCRSSSENALKVAPLTLHLGMASGERETCHIVVDLGVRPVSPLSSGLNRGESR